jgi:hypothetical protein
MRILPLATALTLLLTLPIQGEQITTDQKEFLFSSDGRYLVPQGTWRKTSQRPTIEVPYVNSVRIECDRTTKICNEYVAKFIQKTDDPLGAVERPYLFLMKEQFRVIEWTETTNGLKLPLGRGQNPGRPTLIFASR